MLSAKLDTATDMSYDVTLSRIGVNNNNGMTLTRLHTGNGSFYR